MVEKSGLLGLCAVRLGNFFSMFRINGHCLRRQSCESTKGQTTLKTTAGRVFETSGSNHPTRRRTDPEDGLKKMKSFSAVPFPATPVVLSATLYCLSLACYTSDKVSCYYGRCTCRLTADLALQQMSYTKCIQHKAILSGGVGGRNADCPSFSIQKEVTPSVSVVLVTQLLQTTPKEGNRTQFQNILSSQVIIVISGCVPFVWVRNMVARIEGGT